MAWTDKRLVLVEWKDANCDNSWNNSDTTFSLSNVWSIGLLWHESPDLITLVGTVSEGGEFNQAITIPRNCISSIEDVTK